MSLPSFARIVIIGGGVIGTSIAYHLAAAGVSDVVLLERGELGSGSTCKAAGGVRTQFSDTVNIQIAARSMAAYSRFHLDHGQEIDLRTVGYLFLLSRPDDVTAFERNVALQNSLGIPTRMVDPDEAKRLSPLIDTEGLLAAAYSPQDGHCTPESVVLGYATAARRRGARLFTRCTVTGIQLAGGEIRAVDTDRGSIATSTVICAAGAWSAAVGEMVGVDLPVLPYRRQIIFTGPVDATIPAPFTIDFATAYYFRREGRGLLIGMSDPDVRPGFSTTPTDDWLPRLTATVRERTPGLMDVGLSGGWAGLYEVTPDHNALIGESTTVSRFLYAAGFSGHGFMQAPAVGEVVSDLVLGCEPCIDIGSLHADRFRGEVPRTEFAYV
ncbi:NAD(P)/FAD-dependent oxidoreductase [Nocardia sp. NPDC003482]